MKTNRQKSKPIAFSRFLSAKAYRRPSFLEELRADFGLSGRRLLRFVSVIILCTMTAMLLRGIGNTIAYLSDTEISADNAFTAGNLDFELETHDATSSICAALPLEKTIHITNFGNPFKYTASTSALTGDVCDYVTLTADINGGEPEYSGPVKAFNFGPMTFADGEDWTFKLSIASTTPIELAGQTCAFTFDFEGSQTRHNLAFPTGFSDFEQLSGDIQAPFCEQFEVRSYGYWKTHPEVYLPLLPVFLGATTTDANGNATGTNEIINTQTKVNKVFNASDSVMRNKLRKQLLAMKFNIFNFHIDAYVPDGQPYNMDELVEQADAMLRQSPPPSDAELEAMKNLLEGVNIAIFIRICACTPPPPPDSCALRLTKTVDKAEAAPGDELTYHLTLDNYGTKVCTGGGVRIDDNYPATLEYLGYTSNRSLNAVYRSTGFIEWNFGSVYPDDPIIEIDFRLKVVDNSGCNKVQCDSTIVNSAKYWSNQTDWSAPVTAETLVVCPSAPDAGKIMINEFLPNPNGSDNAHKPGGEWVELYNAGGSSVDVDGWKIYDNNDSHYVMITPANTDSGSTLIAPLGFLVVYRNGDSDFALNNEGGDSVRLYDGPISSSVLIDFYVYTTDAPSGKSYARIPDGSTNWVDPLPTPGEENSLVGADTVFGPAIAEEGEDGYVAPEPVPAAPDPVLMPDTTTPEPAVDQNPIASPTPTDIITPPDTTPPSDPVDPPALTTIDTIPADTTIVATDAPLTTPEPTPDQSNPNDVTLISQPIAPAPPELILPETPPINDTGTGI
jgi:uncharacterized repeat protein (TIGR01451 family)/predicted ribosomally synthesized peptide with SipW-like signal peptide